ncbi:MAG: PLP-dependent aminotransferase family protein [Candidatus Methanomethylicaceae archaeon]
MNAILTLTRGNPPIEALPVDWIAQCCETALAKYGNVLLQYHSAYGFTPLREILAAEAGASLEEVVVGNGSLQFLHFITRAFLAPGDAVIVERPTYDRAITVFRQANLKVIGIALEEDGVDIDALKRVVREFSPKLFYLIPDFQNPTGITTTFEKREAIARIATYYNMIIVEDIPYRKLRYFGSDVPTLRELVPQNVVQISSFSKIIAPGLRVGWLIAPEPLTERLVKIAEDTYITPNMLAQGIVYEFCLRGFLQQNLQKLRILYAQRLSAMLDALQTYLPQGHWVKPEGGFFVGLWLPEEITSMNVILKLAYDKGLVLAQSAGFFPDDRPANFLRLPFCALPESQLSQAIKCLADIIKQNMLYLKKET